jgi:hypothetical protein
VAGLGEGSLLTVVGGFEFGGWDVAAGFEQAAVVEPVDVLGPWGLINSVLNSPITVSASTVVGVAD